MLDINVYKWKDMRQKRINAGNGRVVTLQQLNSGVITRSKKEILKDVLELYGFKDVIVEGGNDATGVQFQYQSKREYGFSVVLQGTKVTAKANCPIGTIYFKTASGTTSYQTVNIIDGVFSLNSSGTNTQYDFGYVVEAMSEGSTYLWNDGKDILNQLITPLELVNAIDEDDLNNQELFSSDIVDPYGDTVEHKYLNQVASYHTIPRYYIGNKSKSFKGISFDYNVSTFSDNIDNQGQYIFNNHIQYKGGSKKDTKYWSFKPEIYPMLLYDSDESVLSSAPNLTIQYADNYIKYGDREISIQNDDVVLVYVRKPSHSITNTSYPDWRIGHNYTSEAPVKPIDSFSSEGTFTAKYKIYEMKKTTWNINLSLTGADNILGDEVSYDLFKTIIQNNKGSFSFKTLEGNDPTGETAWGGILIGNRWESFMSIGTYTLSKDNCTLSSKSNLTFSATYDFDALDTYSSFATFGDVTAHLDFIDTKHFAFGGVTDWDFVCKGSQNYLKCDFTAKSGFFQTQIPFFKEGYVYSNVKTWSAKYDAFDMDFDCQIGYNKTSYGDIGVAVVVWRNGKLVNKPNPNPGFTPLPW